MVVQVWIAVLGRVGMRDLEFKAILGSVARVRLAKLRETISKIKSLTRKEKGCFLGQKGIS